MDSLTGVLAFLVTLSLATERITEVIKGLPLLSKWFSQEKQEDSPMEDFRKSSVQLISIAIGTGLAYSVKTQIVLLLKLTAQDDFTKNALLCLLFGAMASGGSGMWNSLLDSVREIKRQKEELTKSLKNPPAGGAPVTIQAKI